MSDYTRGVLAPHEERERQIEMQRMIDAEAIKQRERENQLGDMGKKVNNQYDIDDFNRK